MNIMLKILKVIHEVREIHKSEFITHQTENYNPSEEIFHLRYYLYYECGRG